MVAKRRERLQIEAVLDEIVVFNHDTSEATALNQTATIVFNLCDGEHDVTAITFHNTSPCFSLYYNLSKACFFAPMFGERGV